MTDPMGGAPLPAQPDAESRNYAMAAHLTALAGAFVGGVGSWVGPLIVWLLRKDNDPFTAEHAREALNFNLFVLLLAVAAFILAITIIGLIIVIPGVLVMGVLWLIWTIQASLAASRGELYRYPLSIRFIS